LWISTNGSNFSGKENPFFDQRKKFGMDAPTEGFSIAVRNAVGKMVMQCVIETKA